MLDLRELSDDMLLARPERLTMDHRHADGTFDQVRAWLMAAERERAPAGSGAGCECRSRHERLPTHFATVSAQLGVVASSSQRRSSVCRPFFYQRMGAPRALLARRGPIALRGFLTRPCRSSRPAPPCLWHSRGTCPRS